MEEFNRKTQPAVVLNLFVHTMLRSSLWDSLTRASEDILIKMW